jgi:hypothetical protein
MKKCGRCKEFKAATEFYSDKSTHDGLCNCCKDCSRVRSNEIYRRRKTKDPEKILAYNRKNSKIYRERNRQTVLDHYGNVCVCCGETESVFLAVDHIEGGGTQHIKEIGTNFYRWIINNKFPENLQLLCHNCNFAKHRLGKCPHQIVND